MLKRWGALRISRELKRLRETFRASYPRVPIEDVLPDVDEWCSAGVGILRRVQRRARALIDLLPPP